MTREILTNRRDVENLTFWFEGRKHEVSLGFYPDGRLAEMFVGCAKVGTPMALLMKEAGILISFALQHGCTVEMLRKAMPRMTDGVAEGFVGALLDHIETQEVTA